MKRIVIYTNGHQEIILVPDDVVDNQRPLFDCQIYTVSNPKDSSDSKVEEPKQ